LITQQRGIGQVLHRHGPIAHALHIEEVGLGTEREQQMVKLKLQLDIAQTSQASNLSCRQVDSLDISLNDLDVMKNAPQRIDNIAGRKIARCYFMQHRSEENKVFATNKGDFDIIPPRQALIEMPGCIQSGKSAASDDYVRLCGHLFALGAVRLRVAEAGVISNALRLAEGSRCGLRVL
jgi:hypothetical protein